MQKVIYLIDQPLDKRNFKRFGIELMLKEGWEVEIWDITYLMYPEYWNYFNKFYKKKKFSKYFLIKSNNQINFFLKKLKKDSIIIDQAAINLKFLILKIRNYCKQKKITRISTLHGSFPKPKKKLKEIINFNLLKFKSIKTLIRVLLLKVIYKYLRSDILLISGSICLNNLLTLNANKIVHAHNFDYDKFLLNNIENIPKKNSNKTCVFLDQDLPYHIDRLYRKDSALVKDDEYYTSLYNFFTLLSEKFKIDIKICLHPRSLKKPKTLKYFSNFNIVTDQTEVAVKECDFVLAHYSTAIQLPVLYNKPIIFITNNELESSIRKNFVSAFAESLGKDSYNIDSNIADFNLEKELKINQLKYTEYISKYIKIPNSEKLLFWKIVSNECKKLNKRN
jgi:hypothetical protein